MSKTSVVSKLCTTLNTGAAMPLMGLGTYRMKPDQIPNLIDNALRVGYRHFDGALAYGNSDVIGDILPGLMQTHGISRDELFITDKLFPYHHDPKHVAETVERSLKNWKLDFLDLYLIHVPFSYAYKHGQFPDDMYVLPEAFADVDHLETWAEMEKLVVAGLVKTIGVSNFNRRQLSRVIRGSSLSPAVNQVECHPYLSQSKLLDFCRDNRIHISAYRPLCAPFKTKDTSHKSLLTDPILTTIAERYGKTVAQIALRFNVQRGVSVLPMTSSVDRLKENFHIWNFELSNEDMAEIERLNVDYRGITFEGLKTHKNYPFHDDF